MKRIPVMWRIDGARRVEILMDALSWANRQLCYEISWSVLRPGGLLKLNPNLLRRFN